MGSDGIEEEEGRKEEREKNDWVSKEVDKDFYLFLESDETVKERIAI